jgi:hypothetical protein
MGLFSAERINEPSSVTARHNEMNGGNCDNRLLKSRTFHVAAAPGEWGHLGSTSLVNITQLADRQR